MTKPILLDLFCGAGGASVGYHRAGFHVIGVDIEPQPHYPYQFIRADALRLLEAMLNGYPLATSEDCLTLDDFDVIHASPPCQLYSQSTNMHDKSVYPDLVGPIRDLILETGLPYVIENVPGAPLINPITLCGSQFGVARLRRHRLFESNVPLYTQDCVHENQYDLLSVTGHGEGGSHRGGTKRGPYWGQAERRKVMGIDWMNRTELAEAIPPMFTAFVGRQLMAQTRSSMTCAS